jgi:hypothetical protein
MTTPLLVPLTATAGLRAHRLYPCHCRCVLAHPGERVCREYVPRVAARIQMLLNKPRAPVCGPCAARLVKSWRNGRRRYALAIALQKPAGT